MMGRGSRQVRHRIRSRKFFIGYRRVLDGRRIPMVSFRNSQLRAMVFGLVIADAVTQGQLPWALPGQPTGPLAAEHWSPLAIADDGWSHAIAAQFNQLAHAGPMAAMPRAEHHSAAMASDPATVNDLLIHLPQCLAQFERFRIPLVAGTAPASLGATQISTVFCDCLQACLRQDATALHNLHRQLPSVPPAPLSHTGLAQAMESVLAAHGDFQLAVGQSLQLSTTTVGVPVLVGMLSASWGDLPSLPSRYRHWLQQPSSELRLWLQQRWQITSEADLNIWAESLWQQWSGQYQIEPGRSLTAIAVLPRARPV